MILDNSCIDYARMLFSRHILAPPPTPGLLRDYKSSRQCCQKTKYDVRENNFFRSYFNK